MRSTSQMLPRIAARCAVLAVALGFAPLSDAGAQAIPAAGQAGGTITIGGLTFAPGAGAWTARPGAAEMTCAAESCAGAVLTVVGLDAPCDDELLRRRAAKDDLALRAPPSDLAGQGLVFRAARLASPCRSLSGDTLVACTSVAGRTRLVELSVARDARCRLPTSAAKAAEALLATGRAVAP
jgi:hypothetical protein